MKSSKKTAKKKNFDQLLGELEKIVSDLESGNYPLEDTLEKYEQGVSLYKDCKQRLGKAEQKIKVLSENLKEENLD